MLPLLALVVDDSKSMRAIIRRILIEIGFEILEAENAKEALKLLADGKRIPRLIMVDWNMPEMNGLDFISKVRSDSVLVDVPLVMVTSENEPSHLGAALKAGASEYVMKPFTKEMLIDKLRLLGRFDDLLS